MLHTAFEPYEEFLVEYIRKPEKSDMKVQHYHDTYEIYLQISGDRTLILNDVRYTLRPGDLYILKPFEIHYTESRESDSYERYIINLPVPVLHSLLTEGETRLLLHKLDSCVLHLSDEQAAEVLEHFKKADACHNRSGFLAESCFAPSSCSCWYCWVSFWRTQAPRILWTAKASSLKSYPLSIISIPIIRKTLPWMPRPGWSI